MEKVQFQLEATIPELKDLHEKGLFTKHEIDQITRRRTAFETSLIRPVTRKDDFFKYAEYEINLERLRKIRWKKMNYHINPPPPSASTYSLPRRTLYILKRATAKFPGDLAVWLAYVEFAAKEGMTKIVVKGLNSALQHLPLSPTLYLLLAYHHLHPGSPLPRSNSSEPTTSSTLETESSFTLEGTGPARTTLLLGLRMLPTSHLLWREYIKLELGWVEALRRRWNVLGINTDVAIGGSGEAKLDAAEMDEGEGAFGPEGESARQAILAGQLVDHALDSAMDKIRPSSTGEEGSGIEFRAAVVSMLRTYPSSLRTRALAKVYADLEAIKSADEVESRARLVLLTRGLYDRTYDPEEEAGAKLTGVEYVEEMGKIGKAIRKVSKQGLKGWSDVAGRWLAARINECEDNSDLRKYLYSIFTLSTKSSPSPELLTIHLDLVRSDEPSAYLSTARRHASAHPSDANLQLRWVQAETELEYDPVVVRKACADAIKRATVDHLPTEVQDIVQGIWTTWVEWEETQSANSVDGATQISTLWKRILRDSLRTGSVIPRLHATLLSRYFLALIKSGNATPPAALSTITSTYRPTPDFFRSAFATTTELSGRADHLAKVYAGWRPTCRSHAERVEAALVWAEWLVQRGKGKEARDTVEVVRMEVKGDEEALGQLEAGWTRVLDEVEESLDEDQEGSKDEDEEDDAEEDEEDDDEGEDEDEEDEEAEGDDDGDLVMF